MTRFARMRMVSLRTGLGTAMALLLAACGGGEATPTSAPPTPTRAPAPAPTATPPPATPTRAAPTPTQATPAPVATQAVPAPTTTPTGAVATPALLPGKRGGTLVTRSNSQPIYWDTLDIRGWVDVATVSPMLNSLIFTDPYGDGKTLVGDVAERWDFSEGGKVLTFPIRRGIKFHDGAPMTAKDVAYNLDRAWKPRSPTMTYFTNSFSVIQKIETLDDFTLRITLSQASNIFLQSLAQIPFQIYPAHQPFPEKFEEWRNRPIGTGPFKFKALLRDAKMEYVRNPDYWKPGLPYLDGFDLIQMAPEAVVSAFRVGRLDASNLDTGVISNSIDSIAKATGFIYKPIVSGLYGIEFNQRAPWTDPRVREAIDLAIDRKTILDTALLGMGTIYAPPMMPVELGGLWGRSIEEFKDRPGYRQDKRDEDIARAKALLAQAGVDPSKVTVNYIGPSGGLALIMETADESFRRLGFKTLIEPLAGPQAEARKLKGDLDLELPTAGSIQLDDPGDIQANFFRSGGAWNWGKWSDPRLDALFVEQDRTLDAAKRRPVIRQMEDLMLDLRWHIGIVWRQAYVGHQPWVKNFPLKLPFQFQQKFRHEQVWLDR